jgi:hypothetical protein
MSEVKQSSRARSRRRRRRMPTRRSAWRNNGGIIAGPNDNVMVYTATWFCGVVQSGTSGIINTTSTSSIASTQQWGATIQNSTEYSSLNNIFSEIRLLSAQWVFSAIQSVGSTQPAGAIVGGTHMGFNSNAVPTVTTVSGAENLTNRAIINTNVVRPFVYSLAVPSALEFSRLDSDAPATVTPWAGSPGYCTFYGTAFGNSQNYFQVYATARWVLRGRI